MTLPQRNIYTTDDIYALPEGQRAELIDGQIYDMAPPNTMHQRIVMNLSRKIANYIESRKGTCEVFPAPFAVFPKKDSKNYVEPDISVICDKDKLDDRGCNGAPDWIIEIVSPSSRKHDYTTKTTLYSETGVREYWIVDPAKERVTVYFYEEDVAPVLYTFDLPIPCGIFPELTISIADLLT